MQSMWKACLHLGSSRRISTSSNLAKQTAHSRPSLVPLREEKRKKGRDSTTVLSRPAAAAAEERERWRPSWIWCWPEAWAEAARWQNLA